MSGPFFGNCWFYLYGWVYNLLSISCVNEINMFALTIGYIVLSLSQIALSLNFL